MPGLIDPAREYIVIHRTSPTFQPGEQARPCIGSDFKLHWPPSLALGDRSSVSDVWSTDKIADLQLDEITAPQFTVDSQIEQRAVTDALLAIEKEPDRPYSMVRFPEGVFGDSSAYAEFVSVPANQVGHKPRQVDHMHAAAAPMSLLTAWQFLIDLGHNEPNPVMPEQHRPVPLEGKTVMVNGAAGGVGHFVVQIAKWKGSKVIAVASTRHKQMLIDLGVDQYIDYTQDLPEDVVREVDLVVDCVGGPDTVRFLKSIKRGGALFPIFPLGFEQSEDVEKSGVTVSATQVRSSGKQLDEIAPLLADGTIRAVIDSTYPLADAAGAHRRAGRGNLQGKLVLTVE